MNFFLKLYNQLVSLRVVEKAVIFLLCSRLLRWEGDTNIVPQFAEYKYTYHDVWYFIHVRLIESLLFFSLYGRTRVLVLLIFGLWGLGKIFDELVDPFHYYKGELIWQLVSILIAYFINQWIQRQKQKQPD